MNTRKPRWLALVAVAAIGLSACSGEASPSGDAPGELEEVTFRIGRQPPAGMSAVISQYMINSDDEVFKELAREAGYEVTVEWQNFPSAQPMIDAMLADQLDAGLFGSTPIIRSIAGDIGILPISIGLGHENQYFAMRPDGPVHKVEDLRGKRIGLILGGEQQVFLSNVLNAAFGTADPEQLDIELVSLENQGQTCSVPEGTDVTLCINSVGLPKIMAGEITWAFDMFGNTGPAYDGPAGQGEGHKVPEVENSPYQPEGFFLARAWWVATSNFIDEYPELVEAFVRAEQAALDDLKSGTAGEASEIVFEDFQMEPDVAGPLLENDMLWIRGWVWPTESDYWGFVSNSQLLAEVGAIDEPVTWDQVLEAVEHIAPILESAYDGHGSTISDEEFTESSVVLGGLPLWRSDEWEKRE
jgi:ABC-type nitrate/sulfonate/bicarbonate transport system substrate-binding protein